MVREGIAHRIDLIKVIASGAFLALGGVPQMPEFTEEEVRAAVQEAGKAGLKVAAHAHAREGMFLPLLTVSMRNNGARMLGMTVEVYTSDSWLFLYTISEVNRHTLNLDEAINTTTERLFMQTSEGPNGTVPKLQVVADYLSSAPTDPIEAHPKAHPRICH